MRIYEITEGELDELARGSPESAFLNFALFLLPIALTSLVSLLTTTTASIRLFAAFVLTALVTFISGSLLLVMWWRSNRGSRRLVEEIRNRMPPAPGIQDETGPPGGMP